MTDFALYLSCVVNLLLAVMSFLVVRGAIRAGRLVEARGKRLYSFAAVAGGLLSGIGFNGVVLLLRAMGLFGGGDAHGERVLAAMGAFLSNVLLTLILMAVGRILLGWQPVRW